MRVLGLDPGLNTTGYGVVERDERGRVRLVEAGVVRGGRRDATGLLKGTASLAHRLADIHDGVAEVIRTLRPDAISLEELYSHYERPRTAILMGHARGVIVLAAQQAGLQVAPYAATRIKKVITGAGRAPKLQVQLAIQRELGLAAPPEPPDVADALAIALTHLYLSRQQAAGSRQ
ncbi:MAG: crossover junction endodeoxyribonuclease RuvC [Lacipirellulaceae bacterium]